MKVGKAACWRDETGQSFKSDLVAVSGVEADALPQWVADGVSWQLALRRKL